MTISEIREYLGQSCYSTFEEILSENPDKQYLIYAPDYRESLKLNK